MRKTGSVRPIPRARALLVSCVLALSCLRALPVAAQVPAAPAPTASAVPAPAASPAGVTAAFPAEVLAAGRWYNDEFAFHFSGDGTFKSFFTQGPDTGTVYGTWKADGAALVLAAEKTEGPYNPAAFASGPLTLNQYFDANSPKSTRSLRAASGAVSGVLVVWHDKDFVKAESAITLAPGTTPCVTSGYRLTATTDNLRVRAGPGTTFEYMIYTYQDQSTKEIKTHTSVLAGTNVRILARTRDKFKVNEWYNNWYYVEYKEPAAGIIAYRNAWMFGEFLNVTENKQRAVTVTNPDNEAALYGPSEVTVQGTVTGAPVSMSYQVKDAYGKVLKRSPVTRYSQTAGTFDFSLAKATDDLFIGSNTVVVTAFYSDNRAVNKQITFYLHEYAGEKAKPVIYLYPERESDVRVTVAPRGGISVSDPAYGTGWNVRARPDGTIINKADGKQYKYLFWESPEGTRPVTTAGFVVERAGLPAFFREKLAVLGLNPAEIADFLEFWIPVLNEGPYYYISFIDQATQDAEAPLSVSPKPDTVIRVFFDSKPLTGPQTVVPQTLVPRTRRGFTVTEWGGMRYRH